MSISCLTTKLTIVTHLSRKYDILWLCVR